MNWKTLLALVLIVAATSTISITKSNNSRSEVTQDPASEDESDIRYLPLGDSYTIGQSVTESERWPNQLVEDLDQKGVKLKIVANPSVTGYTSQELIDAELPLLDTTKPDFVTILIGVNDYVQAVDVVTYEKNLDTIITVVQSKLVHKGNVVLITIPDFAKTSAGATFGNPDEATKAVSLLNDIITKKGKQYGIPVADIFPVSQLVSSNNNLVARDGLHPSGEQYSQWKDIILQKIENSNLPKN